MQTDSRGVEQQFLSLAEVARWAGISKSSVLRWVESGDFPQRRRLGPNRVGWALEELLAWADSREPVPGASVSTQEPASADSPKGGDERPEGICPACGCVSRGSQGDLKSPRRSSSDWGAS
jgi:predicted DNA-binding transcriptional regulator AlpA